MGLKMAKKNEIISLDNGFTRNQSNVSSAIATARTKMTALELKTFYQTTTLIQMDDSEFKEYEISVSDFMKALKISDTNREQVVKLCRRLVRQVFEIEQENGDYIGYTIFSRMHYKHKEQKIAMKFNEEFRPFLLSLKQFTKIQQVKYIIDFDSKYAIRFYALLKNYRKMTHRDFNLEALSRMLELPKSITDSYTRLYDKVINPALREINAKSDLEITNYEIIKKRGKKITDVRISFRNKNQKMSDDFVNELIKKYKKYKTFGVFHNAYFAASEKPQSISELYKLQEFRTNKNTYYEAITGFDSHNPATVFATSDKDKFLKGLANGIYRALNFIYENEKKEQLPTLQWQDEKDKVKRIKEIFSKWQNNPSNNLKEAN